MLFAGIRPFHDQFRCRVAVNGKVHFVLHGPEELPGRLGVLIVVKRRGIQVGDLLIEFSLRQSNLADLLQLPLKVLVREHMTLFQALHIHSPALNGMVLDDLSGPLAELHCTLVVYLEANGDDHLEIIVVLTAADLTIPLGLNCQVFLDSCFRRKLTICVNSVDMLRDRLLCHIIQCRHHLLCQPDILVLIPHFIAGVALTGGGHKSQILSC